MPQNQDEILEMLADVASALGPGLLARTVFVGGATTGLFVTDPVVIEGVRLTDDVDLIIDVLHVGAWANLQEELRRKGFSNDQDGPICRMRLGHLKVDFMPEDEAILGFSNRWYRLGLDTAVDKPLTGALSIRVLTPALFLATKLEAYLGRGNNDPMGSKDIDDILVLLDGRETLAEDVREAPMNVQDYIASQLAALLANDQFDYAVSGNIRGGAGRIAIIYDRINALIAGRPATP